MDTAYRSAVPRMSHGYSVTVESGGEYVDRELLHVHMEEYGMVKDVTIGKDTVVVTFFEERSAQRAWVHLRRCFEGPVRLSLLSPSDHRGRLVHRSRSRSRSRTRDTWCHMTRRAVSMSPTPKRDVERSSADMPCARVLRQRSRSLQQLVGSIDHMFD